MSFSARICLLAALLEPITVLTQPTDGERQLWSTIKRALVSDDGHRYFEESMKNAMLPNLYGTVVSATPAEKPTTIVLALSDKASPEVTLQLIREVSAQERHSQKTFAGRINRGDEIEFAGIAVSFAQKPFMLTVDAPIDRLRHIKSHAR